MISSTAVKQAAATEQLSAASATGYAAIDGLHRHSCSATVSQPMPARSWKRSKTPLVQRNHFGAGFSAIGIQCDWFGRDTAHVYTPYGTADFV